jgi:hypothetical protein
MDKVEVERHQVLRLVTRRERRWRLLAALRRLFRR